MSSAAYRHQLDAFVADHRGWKVAEPDDTEAYAWRTVEVVDTAYHLFLRRNPDRPLVRDGWTSSCRSKTRGPARTYLGTFEIVADEIIRVERCLHIINTLRDCRQRASADLIVESLKGGDLAFVCDVLALARIGSVRDMRRRVVDRTCGARLDHEAMKPKKGGW